MIVHSLDKYFLSPSYVLGIGLAIRTTKSNDDTDNKQLQDKMNVHEHRILELKGSWTLSFYS